MPIEVQYTDDNKGVNFIAVGEVSGKEIIESEKEIFKRDNFLSLKYWIVDRSRCTKYVVTSDEIKQIAVLDKNAAKINPKLLQVLISETDLQYGMSRMYQAYVDEDGFKTMIFRNREAAEE